jgi:hypothetical protein
MVSLIAERLNQFFRGDFGRNERDYLLVIVSGLNDVFSIGDEASILNIDSEDSLQLYQALSKSCKVRNHIIINELDSIWCKLNDISSYSQVDITRLHKLIEGSVIKVTEFGILIFVLLSLIKFIFSNVIVVSAFLLLDHRAQSRDALILDQTPAILWTSKV